MPSSDRDTEQSPGVFDTLLMPLRLPGRVVADVGTLAQGVSELVVCVRAMHQSLERVDERVAKLESLESAVGDMMKGLREDLNTRMVAVEEEVRGMLPPIEKMARDVSKIDGLLPNASDGPLTRLKDTLSSGS